MNVTRIWLRGFGAYDGVNYYGPDGKTPSSNGVTGPPLELKLEPGNLYVVTGQNGSGKSTLVEAVAFALWGKTLRGEPLLRPEGGDPRPSVSVTVDGLLVNRGRRYGQPQLYLGPEDKENPQGIGAEYDTAHRLSDGPLYGTAKEAQRVLDTYVGTFEQWRRTHVFSSADAAHFSLATDGERKRLIEGFLGLERFDEALGTCRDAIKRAERAQEGAANEAGIVARRLREYERYVEWLDGAEEDPEPELPLEPPQAQDTNGLLQQLREARQRSNEALTKGSETRAAAAQLRTAFDKLAEGEPCPCCGQWVGADALAAAREWVEMAEHGATKAEAAGQAERQKAEADELEYAQRLERARAADAERKAWKAKAEARAAWLKRRQKAAEELADWRSRVSKAELELADANKAEEQALAELQELNACERVLGLKGVRSAVLASSLGALEALANAWLRKLGMPGLVLKLSHYTERADGSLADAISLDLGRGAELRPYRSASGGERRRADVALLLALGELAAGASGRERGTIFADEVFDCLDREGQEAVLGALLDLAKKGPSVVLVTHAGLGDLLRGREGVVRLEVAEGRVTQVE